ncbi:Superoxide dismutase [Mycoemilia scoparia]|uniref:Superoxide dismutase n=1 Tax=Mycoemilia scoparia TaxID=417184 RepID=A0A9W8DUQ9_9FUNG|nr:Superoxide dismutase [Mycoemilia scoparia]
MFSFTKSISATALVVAALSSLAANVVAWHDVAVAELQCKDFCGTFTFSEGSLSKGKYQTLINVKVDRSNPAEHYMWHIHDNPVAAGDQTCECNSVGGHFNPTKIPEGTKCDPSCAVDTCHMGDLAGVYGNITGGSYTGKFEGKKLNLYTPTKLAQAGTSIVVHDCNGKKVCCGTINLVKDVKGNPVLRGSSTKKN